MPLTIDCPTFADQSPQGLGHEIAFNQETINRAKSGARDCSPQKSDQSPIHSNRSLNLPDPCEDVSDLSLTPIDHKEHQDEDPSNSTMPTTQSPENILEITTTTTLVNLKDKSIGYQLAFR
ncbi:unnamed protein product [Prunus armeniaca]